MHASARFGIFAKKTRFQARTVLRFFVAFFQKTKIVSSFVAVCVFFSLSTPSLLHFEGGFVIIKR